MIKMIGIDHTTAPVDIRAVFSLKKSELAVIMDAIKRSVMANGIVILNTCNRMEIWISGDVEDVNLLDVLCDQLGVQEQDYAIYFMQRDEEEAIRHLMWMTVGLKSAIIAEDQILTQVKQAIDFARQERLCDGVLDVLFRTAITAAKKIKSEVVFHRANATAIEQALHLLSDNGFCVRGKKCMVIGNGEYGRLVAEMLVAQGASVTVTIRQYHSGEVQIPKGCETILYGDKYQIFPECELVVSATASPQYTLFYDKVKACDISHEMILIDLAVPRDIDPKIKELPNFEVYDIDDFKSEANPQNKEAYAQAENIIAEKIEEFHSWYDYRDMIPVIGKIRENAVLDIDARLGKPIRKLELGEEDQEQLVKHIHEATGKVISNLFFHMRDVLEEADFRKCVNAIWECENE